MLLLRQISSFSAGFCAMGALLNIVVGNALGAALCTALVAINLAAAYVANRARPE